MVLDGVVTAGIGVAVDTGAETDEVAEADDVAELDVAVGSVCKVAKALVVIFWAVELLQQLVRSSAARQQ